jgi:hypothetical protein
MIAQINKDNASMIADAMNPAGYPHLLINVFFA